MINESPLNLLKSYHNFIFVSTISYNLSGGGGVLILVTVLYLEGTNFGGIWDWNCKVKKSSVRQPTITVISRY